MASIGLPLLILSKACYKTSMKCILFDHDGTLMNSLDSVVEATNGTLKQWNYPPRKAAEILMDLSFSTEARIARLTGNNDPVFVDEVSVFFYNLFTEVSRKLTRPFPGIAAMLKSLNTLNITLGIVSNCRGDVVRINMETNKLTRFFPVVLGEEDFRAHKPDPSGLLQAAAGLGISPADCIYIGDGPPDFHAAAAAGMKSGMVTWGHLPRKQIEKLAPDMIFDRPEDILEACTSVHLPV